MARTLKKSSFGCPHCGFVQSEPAGLVSTFCRSCGAHYNAPRIAAGPTPVPSVPPAPAVARQTVSCHHCGCVHEVSRTAWCTICPGCAASIDLLGVSFFSTASRPVDTRGKLVIGPEGCLTTSRAFCGTARILGRIVGSLVAEGEVRIGTNHTCACHITAPVIVIEKNSSPSFTQLLRTDHLIVFGRLTGIVRCRGTVHVRRGGRLEAEVCARSVTVEKGGALLGACRVAVNRENEPLRPDFDWRASLCPAQ
jgi:cytoskeletal protein CcmA (bactofilin family)